MPSSPTVGNHAAASLYSVSISASANSLLVLFAGVANHAGSGAITIATVSCPGASSFVNLKAKLEANSVGTFGNADIEGELWVGIALTSTTYTITVTTSASPLGNPCLTVVEVKNAYNTTLYLDADLGNPWSAGNATAAPVITYTTLQPDDLFLFNEFFPQQLGGALPTGWTSLGSRDSGGVGNFTAYLSVSAKQTAQTVQSSAATTGVTIMVAITADPPPSNGSFQTFVVCFGT